MRLRFIGTLALLAMLLAVAAPVAADAPNDCPDPAVGDFADESTAPGETGTFVIDGTTVHYAISEDGKTISFFSDAARTLPLAVEFCVKGGSLANSGVLTLSTYTVLFLNDGGENPAISNFVVYSVPAPGTLTVIKQTNPDGFAGAFTFGATLNSVAQPAFSLSDGQSKVFTGNGTYVITETVPGSSAAGTWSLAIDCGSAIVTPTANGVSVTVTANATISCTFTNTLTPPPGTLTVIKQTNPDGSAGAFTFGATLNSVAQPAFSLSDGQSKVFTGNGTYVITETVPSSSDAGSWSLAINCGSAAVTPTATGVSVTVTANAGISCTFTNTFTPVLSGGGGGGGGGTVVTTPVRQGTLASVPNTAMPVSPAAPVELAASLGGLLLIGSGIGFSLARRLTH